MKLNTVMGGDPSLNTRLYVSRSATGPSSSPDGGIAVSLRRPTTAETFGRRLLNALSFGAYTRRVANPREWKAFKAAVLLGAVAGGEGAGAFDRRA